MNMKIIITRHKGLVEYLAQQGLKGTVVSHASEQDVTGRDVIGVLPLRLACLTQSFIEVSLTIPLELRGVEMTLEQIYSCKPVLQEYVIKKINKEV